MTLDIGDIVQVETDFTVNTVKGVVEKINQGKVYPYYIRIEEDLVNDEGEIEFEGGNPALFASKEVKLIYRKEEDKEFEKLLE